MSITKRGSCKSNISVVSELYICDNCKTKKTLIKDINNSKEVICPNCNGIMSLCSSNNSCEKPKE